MDSRQRVLSLVVAIVAGAAVVVWLLPAVDRVRRPEPKAAWIAVEVEGSGIARMGPVTLNAGERVRLHAVLEAEVPGGEKVYFTEASAIDLGDGPVPAESIRRWSGPQDARILWLTLEGAVPFRVLAPDQSLESFRFEEFFHPEWGRGWSAAGSLESRHHEQLAGPFGEGGRPFGTQRYQVWIELFADTKAIVPAQRLKSPGFDELLASPQRFPTVAATLEGARAASRVFGLSQLEAAEGSAPELLEKLADLYGRQLSFSRLLVLRSILEDAGTSLDDLESRRVDLEKDRLAWGSEAHTGDLVRVGARWVVLYRDAGDAGDPGVVGRLDPLDLCFDFDRGAEVRPIGEVFVGDGEVELATLASPP